MTTTSQQQQIYANNLEERLDQQERYIAKLKEELQKAREAVAKPKPKTFSFTNKQIYFF